ncbi:MAG: ATP synthase F1 subunit delta [Chloroflexota bacterium]|nr:ATP synthase F1 subunit delta [Chloroflexota bacterium]
MAHERPSEVYAQVAFDQAVSNWLAPLKTLAASLAKSGLAERLDDAGLPFSKKQELLQPMIPPEASDQVRNLVFLLATKSETHLLPEIVGELDRFANRGKVGETARVTSAVTLNDSERRTLESKMRAQFGKEISFDYAVDAALLGGVIVRVGDKVIDGSVAGKLAALKEELK